MKISSKLVCSIFKIYFKDVIEYRLLLVIGVFTIISACVETKGLVPVGVTEITVNEAEIISADQVIDSVNFLVLDTSFNALMSGIVKFDIHNDIIYCLKIGGAGAIMAFNIEGRFIFKIDRVGRAFNEWIALRQFHVDRINNRLLLLDSSGKKIIITDLHGNFIKSVTLRSLIVYDAIGLSTGEFIIPSSFDLTGGEKNDYTKHKIHMFDSSGKPIGSFLKSTFVDYISTSSENELSMNSQGDVFYAPMFLNTIFKVARDSVMPYYSVVYSGDKDMITDKYINNIPRNGYRLIRDTDEEKYIFYDGSFVDSERYVYVRMGKYYPIDVFYDKQTKETITTRLFSSYDISEIKTCNTYAYQPPRVFYKGEWWAGISPAFLDIPQDYFEGEKSELYNEMRQIYDSHKEGCNMFVRYKLKNR